MGRKAKDPLDIVENDKFVKGLTVNKRGPKKAKSLYPDEHTLFDDLKTYCEELLWIRDKRGKVIPFVFTGVQAKLHERIERETAAGNRKRLILKYRRPGITTYMQARSFHRVANNENQYAVTLAHDNLSTGKIFNISLLFYEKLVKWAKPHRKTESKKELNFQNLGSSFYIGTAGGESFGRGQTLQRVHGSEIAFWPKSTDHASLVAGLLEAASHGEVDFETTANGHGNWFHKTWVGAKEGENDWVPIFLSWKDDPELYIHTELTFDKLKLDSREEDLVKKYNLKPGQILWRRQKMRDLHDPDLGNNLFHQEYPINDVEAFIATGACFFDTEIIQHLANMCDEPIQYGDSRRLRVWKEPLMYHSYTLSADVGEGVPEGDRTVLTVMDTDTCEEVACWVGICSPEEAARKAADLGNLYNTALIAPEANGYGHSMLNTLLNETSYPAVYQHEDYTDRKKEDGVDHHQRWGWHTNVKTRPIMITELRHAIQGGYYKVNDKQFFQEALTFTDNGHGKYEAGEGNHDDRIIAHAINWQARKRSIDITGFDNYVVPTGHVSIAARWEDF